MKKKSTSQSAPACHSLGEGGFFSLRLLIGLFIVLAGVFMALLGLGALSNGHHPIWDPLRADPAFQKLCDEKQP